MSFDQCDNVFNFDRVAMHDVQDWWCERKEKVPGAHHTVQRRTQHEAPIIPSTLDRILDAQK
jgi:hypothetical protein